MITSEPTSARSRSGALDDRRRRLADLHGSAGHPRSAWSIVNYGSHQLIRGQLRLARRRRLGVTVLVVDNFKSSSTASHSVARPDRLGFTPRSLGPQPRLRRRRQRRLDHRRTARAATSSSIANPDLRRRTRRSTRSSRERVDPDPARLISPARRGRRRRATGAAVARSTWSPAGCGPGTTAQVRPGCRGPASRRTVRPGHARRIRRRLLHVLGGRRSELPRRTEVDGVDVLETQPRSRHAVGGTQPSAEGKSPLYVWHNCRGRLVFAGKHLDPIRRLRWLLHTPADVRRVLSRGGRPTRVRKIRLLVPALAGCLSALPWLIAPKIIRLVSDRRRSLPAGPRRRSSGSENGSSGCGRSDE